MGWNDFSLPVRGGAYCNEDGSCRQSEIARCLPGDLIRVEREPDNPHDHMAVALVSERGVRLGYLSRTHAGWIGSKIDRDYDVRAIVERVRQTGCLAAPLALVVRLNLDGDEPELPEPTSARVVG